MSGDRNEKKKKGKKANALPSFRNRKTDPN